MIADAPAAPGADHPERELEPVRTLGTGSIPGNRPTLGRASRLAEAQAGGGGRAQTSLYDLQAGRGVAPRRAQETTCRCGRTGRHGQAPPVQPPTSGAVEATRLAGRGGGVRHSGFTACSLQWFLSATIIDRCRSIEQVAKAIIGFSRRYFPHVAEWAMTASFRDCSRTGPD